MGARGDDMVAGVHKGDFVYADGSHTYWSTHCRHNNHDACNATSLAPGVPRRPAQCKTCGAPCICDCHFRKQGRPKPLPKKR